MLGQLRPEVKRPEGMGLKETHRHTPPTYSITTSPSGFPLPRGAMWNRTGKLSLLLFLWKGMEMSVNGSITQLLEVTP